MNNNFRKHTICPIPWYHMSVQQNGDFRACCQNIDDPFGKFPKEEKGWFLNAQYDEWDTVRNHEVAKELRRSMLSGEKHSLCNLCWKEEANGLNSKRIYMNKIATNGKRYDIDFIKENTEADGSIDPAKFPLNYFDLRFGNLCNLKCRSCGPNDSSLWYEDYHALSGGGDEPRWMWFYGATRYNIHKNGKVFEIKSTSGVPGENDFEWYNSTMFWNQFEDNLPYLERLYLTGGEPTINKAHFKLLQMCIDAGVAHKIHLEYNTNMYAMPPKIYDQWKHFNSLDIGCSIDGIGEMANYLRPPSTWEVLEKNLDDLGNNEATNIHAKLSTTVSVYNVINFLELAEWLVQKDYKIIQNMPAFHVLHGPDYMSLQVLPLETKQWIVSEYEKFFKESEHKFDKNWSIAFRKFFTGILTFMMAEDRSNLLPLLKTKTEQLDKLRNQNLNDVAPWLAKVLKRY